MTFRIDLFFVTFLSLVTAAAIGCSAGPPGGDVDTRTSRSADTAHASDASASHDAAADAAADGSGAADCIAMQRAYVDELLPDGGAVSTRAVLHAVVATAGFAHAIPYCSDPPSSP